MTLYLRLKAGPQACAVVSHASDNFSDHDYTSGCAVIPTISRPLPEETTMGGEGRHTGIKLPQIADV